MSYEEIIDWLLEGDVSIRYQVYRDLLSEESEDLRRRILTEGWGAQYLSLQMENGHWGKSFYQPKWTSTHYTLLDLRNLCISQDIDRIKRIVAIISREERGSDGGIHPSGSVNNSDVCINGMFLNYGSYFRAEEDELRPAVDLILSQRMTDGGFNCRLNRSGAKHSSLHTTLSAAEGIREYARNQYRYRLPELLDSERTCIEFMLQHRLFLSDRTGELIHPGFLKLAYPGHWRYDILRALDFMRLAGVPYDERLKPALDQIMKKRRRNGTWTSSKHPGRIHFEMEKSGLPSRWNTLRALRVLKCYGRI